MAGKDLIKRFAWDSLVDRASASIPMSVLIWSRLLIFDSSEIYRAYKGLFSWDLAYSTTFNLFDSLAHVDIAFEIWEGEATRSP